MKQERREEYDVMIAKIQHYIKAKKDFFVGGRGVGVECHRMAIGWRIEIERSRFTAYCDSLEVNGDRLQMLTDITFAPGNPVIGEFDLRHYLKVSLI